MKDNNIVGLINDLTNWNPTTKKSYVVYFCKPKAGTVVSNRLEGVTYETDKNKQYIISGTRGEQWIIDQKKLCSTYCLEDGTPITEESLSAMEDSEGVIDWVCVKTQAGKTRNWALQLSLDVTDFAVTTSWGYTLLANRTGIEHGNGDFLLCAEKDGKPDLSDMWVVNGEVFPATYDTSKLEGVKDLATDIAPVPKSIKNM